MKKGTKKRVGVRNQARRIAIFNHKGGIGKTTLTVNIAAAMARAGKSVLLVDSDPQCNLTSQLISSDVVDDLLDNSDKAHGRTLWTALKPIVDGTGPVHEITPYETHGMLLLPGDIKLSNFEVSLNDLWLECFSRKIRGIGGTNALSWLVNECADANNVDFVFYDTGPNIGALNRVILLDCDYFIVPAALDLFSVRALATLGRTLANWVSDWKMIGSLAPDSSYLMPGKPKFLGYVPQRFNIYNQALTSMQSQYLSKLQKQLHSDVVAVLNKVDPTIKHHKVTQAKLGQVRDFGTNVILAQQQGVPLDEVKDGNVDLRDEAHQTFDEIAKKIISRAV